MNDNNPSNTWCPNWTAKNTNRVTRKIKLSSGAKEFILSASTYLFYLQNLFGAISEDFYYPTFNRKEALRTTYLHYHACHLYDKLEFTSIAKEWMDDELAKNLLKITEDFKDLVNRLSINHDLVKQLMFNRAKSFTNEMYGIRFGRIEEKRKKTGKIEDKFYTYNRDYDKLVNFPGSEPVSEMTYKMDLLFDGPSRKAYYSREIPIIDLRAKYHEYEDSGMMFALNSKKVIQQCVDRAISCTMYTVHLSKNRNVSFSFLVEEEEIRKGEQREDFIKIAMNRIIWMSVKFVPDGWVAEFIVPKYLDFTY